MTPCKQDAATDAPGAHTGDLAFLPFPAGCLVGAFVRRYKRFSVLVQHGNESLWAHSNNSGSMLGLTRPGAPVLLSPSTKPGRTLPFTQEAVWLGAAPPADDGTPSQGFWVGVNTLVPNRLLAAAFHAGKLPFAKGYTTLQREVPHGHSRLDALLTGPQRPPLWVECKNVTLVEDEVACFPDAASQRAQKHLHTLMDVLRHGQRAAMFYLVQRPDGACFAPADVIDPDYADLFYEARHLGVEMYVFRAHVDIRGIALGGSLPVRERSVEREEDAFGFPVRQ